MQADGQAGDLHAHLGIRDLAAAMGNGGGSGGAGQEDTDVAGVDQRAAEEHGIGAGGDDEGADDCDHQITQGDVGAHIGQEHHEDDGQDHQEHGAAASEHGG